MIALRPYDDQAAFAVIERLDVSDRIEAEVVRGAPSTHLALWADWRMMQAARVESWVVTTAAGGVPFAVLAIANSGQAGVAEAALLARDHRAFRRPLAALAALLRREMPHWCNARGIHRVEARAWADHPTASLLLARIGFHHETDMPGFGPEGRHVYRQWAWVSHRCLPFTSIRNPRKD